MNGISFVVNEVGQRTHAMVDLSIHKQSFEKIKEELEDKKLFEESMKNPKDVQNWNTFIETLAV